MTDAQLFLNFRAKASEETSHKSIWAETNWSSIELCWVAHNSIISYLQNHFPKSLQARWRIKDTNKPSKSSELAYSNMHGRATRINCTLYQG